MQTVAYMNDYTKSEVHTMLPVGDTNVPFKSVESHCCNFNIIQKCCVCTNCTLLPVYAAQADVVGQNTISCNMLNLISSYANCGILATVSCTKVYNVTGNKYKFVQIVYTRNSCRWQCLDSCYR